MDGLSIADLLTVAGNAVVVTILVEVVKRTLQWPEETTKRFAPALAAGSGIALAVAAAILTATAVSQAVLTGFLAGALAAGIYDVAGEQLGKLVERASGGRIS